MSGLADGWPLSNVALIDFEASCLPSQGHSFPIEVALAKPDGSSFDWIIKPAEAWRYWDWTEEAQSLHGLTRERIENEGLSAEHVLAQLGEVAAGCDVYADSELDSYWLEILADACKAPIPFPIRFLGELLLQRGFTRQDVVRALDQAKAQMPKEHRARDDASRLALMLRLLEEQR